MDTQKLNELISLLDQETGVYEDILKISKNKTNIIIKGKVTDLENIVRIEQSLILQMGKLEGMREKLIEELAGQLDLKPEELTLTELIKHVKGFQSGKLKVCQGKMVKVVNELKSANDMNSRLISSSLDYINFSINLLTNVGAGSNNYGNNGLANENKKRNLFDMKL